MRKSIFQYERTIASESEKSLVESLKDLWRRPKLSFNMFNGGDTDILLVQLSETDQALFNSIEQNLKSASYLVFNRDKQHSIAGFNRLALFLRLVLSAIFNGNLDVAKYFRKAILIKVFFDRLLKRQSIKVVVLPKAENYEARLITAICNENGVNVIVLQHGLIGDNNYQYVNLSGFKYLVWGELFKRRLLERSPDLNVQVTGDPKTDRAFKRAQFLQPRKKLKKILILPNSGQSHTNVSDVLGLVETGIKFAQKYREYTIDIKPHPSDYQEIVVSFFNQFELPQNVSLLDKGYEIDWSIYDVLAINNSAAGIEAAVYSLPLLVYAKNKNSIMVPQYLENGAAYWCTNYTDFVNAMENIARNPSLAQEKSRAMINDQLANQGRATLEVVREIQSMLN